MGVWWQPHSIVITSEEVVFLCIFCFCLDDEWWAENHSNNRNILWKKWQLKYYNLFILFHRAPHIHFKYQYQILIVQRTNCLRLLTNVLLQNVLFIHNQPFDLMWFELPLWINFQNLDFKFTKSLKLFEKCPKRVKNYLYSI